MKQTCERADTPARRKNNTRNVENSSKKPFTKLAKIYDESIIVQKMLV